MDKATKDKLKEVFAASDTDNSGFIEKDELPLLFEKLNVSLDSQSMRNVVIKFDKDKDGKLSYPEFESMLVFVMGEKNKAIQTATVKPSVEQTTKPSPKQGVAPHAKPSAASQSKPEVSLQQATQLQQQPKKTVKAPVKNLTALSSIRSRFDKLTGGLKDKTHQSVESVSGLFVDKDFPANDSVLTKTHRGKGVIWRRPSEISAAPRVFVDGTEEGDVKQGHIGNCWFVGALAVVAASGSDLVEDLFVRSKLEEGRHHIRFYKDFDWVVVEIDDLLPCAPDGRLLFAKCPDPNEFWVPLVEKAYAKLHGAYHQIESGTITDALRDLTGEGVEVIDVRLLPNKADLWPVLLHNTTESFLMGCAIEASGAPERLTEEGLLTNHAYSILHCQEYKGNKLIRIRNPWGQGEWKGAWSDGSKQWTHGARKAFDYKEENDGTFYMNFEDFSSRFNIIHVLRLLTDDVGEVWQKRTFKSEWKGPTAGGCTDHPTWHHNPQFSVTTSQSNNKVFVCLSQPDQRYSTDSEKVNYEAIGAIVLTGKDDKYKKTSLKKDDVVLRPHYAPRRDLSFEFTANPGSSYIIIPTTFTPGVQIAFEVSIYVQKTATIIERDGEMPSKAAEGKWEGKSAGGCPNFPSWPLNPQFNLISEHTVKATITLEQNTKNKKDVEPIGIFLFSVPNRKERVVTYGKPAPVYHSPTFTPAAITQGEVTLEGGKTYVLVPCTFDAKKEKGFHISVSVDSNDLLRDISLQAI